MTLRRSSRDSQVINVHLGQATYPFARLVEKVLSAFGPRWVNEWYAKRLHYFWMPCPLCGDLFGGHEWDGRFVDNPDKPGGTGVCKIHTVGMWTTKGIVQE